MGVAYQVASYSLGDSRPMAVTPLAWLKVG